MNKAYPKRVCFSTGGQSEFLAFTQKEIGASWSELARLVGVHRRTMNDWKREKGTMSLPGLRAILEETGWDMPDNAKIKEPFWYCYKGGAAFYKKCGRVGGDPEYRKKKWHEWWEREGRFISRNELFRTKSIKKPRKSTNLAEFVGIILGDGSIGQRQVTITLNSEDDKEYSKFVINLIKKLFDVTVGVYYRKNALAVDLSISRTELVSLCVNRLGLKRGSKVKQQVDIPKWIKQNRPYSIACVRGLVDTDGCVFTHSYKVNDKRYKYKKLAFTSYSKPLRQSVFKILEDNGLHPRLAAGKDVRLDSITDMKGYFKVFNFHNPKHVKRYRN